MTDSRSVPADGSGFVAHRRELRADGFERAAEVAELLARQVERDVELAASEPRQAALDHVDRPQHPLRKERRRRATK